MSFLAAPSAAHAGEPVPILETLGDESAFRGVAVYAEGVGFGPAGEPATVLLDGVPHPEAVTYWSETLVIFRLPDVPGAEVLEVALLRGDGFVSNPLFLGVDVPSGVEFLTPMPGQVISGDVLEISVAPEFDHGTVLEVAFEYRPADFLEWIPIGTDTDGTGPRAGTVSWSGEGDGWSITLDTIDLAEGPMELRATTVDVFGQIMSGTEDVVFDRTPLAPELLVDESLLIVNPLWELDDIVLRIRELAEEAAELQALAFPIDWHYQRELDAIDQHDIKAVDAEGDSIMDYACAPAAAASCLKYFGDRFPALAGKDIVELAKELAKAAGTSAPDENGNGDAGTRDDDLATAIKKVLKKCGIDPADWDVSIERDPKKIYGSMIKGLVDRVDKIPLVYQKVTTDVNGDGVVDDDDTVSHFVTLSSRGSRYVDRVIGDFPGTHFMVEEKYVDFMNPGTGETEEFRIDDSKEPPELIGFDLIEDGTSGEPWVFGVICVRPPAGSGRGPGLDIALHPRGGGSGETLIGTFPLSGVGEYSIVIDPTLLALGSTLLRYRAVDADGNAAGNRVDVLVAGFSIVDFTASPPSGIEPLEVHFTNLSAPVDSVTAWAWDFDGDGVTDSDEANPTHTYDAAGVYTVTLSAENPHGADVRVYEDLVSVGLLDAPDSAPPAANRLHVAGPTPFRGSTTIRFELADESLVTLDVFDVAGRHVRSLVRGTLEAGPHSTVWDGLDERGRPVAAGMYFVSMRTSSFEARARIVSTR